MNESTILGPDGVTVVARIVDNGDGTGVIYNYDANGNIASQENLTDLPIFTYPPLDAAGALATLLVVEGVVTLTDASNAIHEGEQHLIAEAEAWSLGGG
jgi:hypothetical protein